VQRFSIGFGPVLLRSRRGETEYAISALPLGGYVKMLGEDDDAESEVATTPERAFQRQPLGRRSAIVFAGPAMNFLFAFVAYAVVFALIGVETPSNTTKVGGVSAGLPAEMAGVHADDVIKAVDGRPVTTWEELSKAVVASGGKPITLTIDRGGAEFPLTVTPKLQDGRTLLGETTAPVYRIGIEASHEWEDVGPVQAVGLAARQTWNVSSLVVQGLGAMFVGRVPLRELGGPIAIARAAGQQARQGIKYYVMTMAFLSVNLGVLNLFPIPGLDGGLLFFFLIEAVIRRPLAQRHREIAQQVGLFVLVTLMLFVFYNDIHRLVQQG
jgi:regulator of sigma E protease